MNPNPLTEEDDHGRPPSNPPLSTVVVVAVPVLRCCLGLGLATVKVSALAPALSLAACSLALASTRKARSGLLDMPCAAAATSSLGFQGCGAR